VPAIRVSSLSKIFRVYARPRHRLAEILTRRPWHHEIRALEDVSFTLEPGECLGAIGANGAGKSTLLRILAGLSRPSSGRLEIQGRVSTLLELNSGFHPEFTGRENIRLAGTLLGFSSPEIAARTEEIIAFAELGEFMDFPVRTYSAGMFLRLGFAVATAIEPDVLLIDEALAVGDEYFRGKCIHRLREFRRQNKTIVIVSHDLTLVRSLCDRALLLDRGRVTAQGSPAEVLQAYLDRIYRRAVEEMQGAESNLPPGLIRRGSGEVEITAVRILNRGEENSRAFVTGEPLAIEFDYLVRRELPEPLFGFNLFRADGVLAVSTNNCCGKMSSFALHPDRPPGDEPRGLEPGRRGTARFETETNLLLPGSYELSVNVFRGKSGAATPVDELFAAARFEILPGRFDDRGLFLWPGTWRVR
jgi:ABC-type polysaccharide/polyol phosphate transport system ATPase subunit